MGYGNDQIIGQAPKGVIKPVQPTEDPTFRGRVAGAETAASEGVRAGLKPGTEAATAAATAAIPTPAIYQELSNNLNLSKSVLKQVNRTEGLYNDALKGREPWRIAREYFPSAFKGDPVADKVRRFDTAASQLYTLGSQITRVPGEGAQDAKEFAQKLEAFKPSSNDSDSVIEEKLLGMRELIANRIQYLEGRLGDVKPRTPNINRARAMMGVPATKTIVFDKFGNRVK